MALAGQRCPVSGDVATFGVQTLHPEFD